MSRLLIFLLFACGSLMASAQNGYDIAKSLQSIDTAQFNRLFSDLIEVDDQKLTIENLEILNTLKLFVNSPFSNVININSDETIKYLTILDAFYTDTDGDGIIDLEDKCPTIYGSENHEGCPNGDSYNSSGIAGFKSLIADNLNEDTPPVISFFNPFAGATPIIDGASKFLVARTKREISLAFFNKFSDKLDQSIVIKFRDIDGNIYDISILLADLYPMTHTLLSTIDGYTLPSMGETWVTAFKHDLIDLPGNIVDQFNNSSTFKKSHIGAYTYSIASSVEMLHDGQHPSTIVSKLSNEFAENHTVGKALNLIDMISSDITVDNGLTRHWINQEDLEELDENGVKYLLAWMYQSGRNKSLLPTLITPQKIKNFEIKYKQLISRMSKIQSYIDILEVDQARVDSSYDTSYRAMGDDYLDILISLMNSELLSDLMREVDPTKAQNIINEIIPLANDVRQILATVDDKSYGQGLLETISFIKKISSVDDDSKLIENVAYYGNFLVDIINGAEENNSDQIASILEKYAAPVSSYRMKRRQGFTLDIAAYPGIIGGREFSESNSGFLGITAPIGISLSTKNSKATAVSSSSSLFLSVIDIGAPFTYRFSNDEAEGLPENISWRQIFAPGAYYVYGFKNSPFSLSLGAQYAPQLRAIEVNNVLDDRNTLRLALGLNVDIPIFNLF